MCLIILFSRELSGCPLLLGANREEQFARPSAAPRWLGGRPDVFAGQDGSAGGTWLGVNEVGLLVAVTNRPSVAAADPGTRSRGLLCLDALRQPSASTALAWCRSHLARQPYRPFNLLLADAASAFVIHGRQVPQVVQLPAGLHVLADGDVDDGAPGRLARARGFAQSLRGGDADRAIAGLRVALADSDAQVPPRDRLCRRFDHAGTVSSAVVAVPDGGRALGSFHYAPGAPDRVAYDDLSGAFTAGPART